MAPLDGALCATVALRRDLTAPRTARAATRLLLAQWSVPPGGVCDAVTLVVSELVTNALVHVDADGGVVHLALERTADSVQVVVTDPDPELPRQREAEDRDEGGRGLTIVAHLARSFRVERIPGGKRVCVEVALDAEVAA